MRRQSFSIENPPCLVAARVATRALIVRYVLEFACRAFSRENEMSPLSFATSRYAKRYVKSATCVAHPRDLLFSLFRIVRMFRERRAGCTVFDAAVIAVNVTHVMG